MRGVNSTRSTTVFSIILCFSSILGSAAAAQAGAVQVRDKYGTPTSYYVAGTSSVERGRLFGGSVRDLNTGTFESQIDAGTGWTDIASYCLEPTEGIGFGVNPSDNTGRNFDIGPLSAYPALQPSDISTIQVLWSNAIADSQTSAIKSAAFQSIVWELVMDTSVDFLSGNFRLHTSDFFTGKVYTQANTWLGNITGGVWTTSVPLYALTSSHSQDLLTVVPEPSTLLLYGALFLMVARDLMRGFSTRPVRLAPAPVRSRR